MESFNFLKRLGEIKEQINKFFFYYKKLLILKIRKGGKIVK